MQDTITLIDENNNEHKCLIDMLGSELCYYYPIIRSMLVPGHETELIFWFRSMGLIPNTQICINGKVNEYCNKAMEWSPLPRSVDYYQWKCKNCSAKKTIKDNSIFQNVKKCSFNNIVRILLGWCKGYDVESMTTILGIKKHSIKLLYTVITEISLQQIRRQFIQNQLGGPGVVVIIDAYPSGCANTTPIRGTRSILCIAEVKNTPPTYYFEALDRFRINSQRMNEMIENNLKTIQQIVKPGSILVANRDSIICSYYHLQNLKHLYPTIVSVTELERHNTAEQSIGANLHTIWKPALDLCEEAQLFPHREIPNFLASQMWQARYGNEGFERLINYLTEMH